MLSLALALPPLPSSCSLSSASSSPLLHHCLPLLLLQASHGHHPDHWMLMELTLGVHQAICLGSLDSHTLIHLPCHSRVERSKHFHGKLHLFALVLHHAVLPEGVLLLLKPQPTCLLSSSTISVAASLSIILCTSSGPPIKKILRTHNNLSTHAILRRVIDPQDLSGLGKSLRSQEILVVGDGFPNTSLIVVEHGYSMNMFTKVVCNGGPSYW